MDQHLLSWTGAGIVTIDLDDDRRLVLVFTDPDLAAIAGQAVQEAAGKAVEVVEVDLPPDQLSDALDVLLGIAGADPSVTLAFPDDPLFDAVLAQLIPG